MSQATEGVRTLANVITVVRTTVSLALGVVALAENSLTWLVAAYAVYWVGDIADGMAARWRDEETVIGAVFDVICDRLNTTVAAAAFVAITPEVAPAIGLFLFEFCVVDTMLTLAFLYFPGLISPNYFWQIDRPIYRWNWSPAAKAGNTAIVVLLCLIGQVWLAVAWAAAVTVVKVLSLRRLHAILHHRIEAAPKPDGVAANPIFG